MRFGVLGPMEVHAGGRGLDVGHVRQRTVLAILLVEAGKAVSVDQLADRVWGADPPQRVRETLRSYEPGPELQRLHQRILRQDPDLAAVAPAARSGMPAPAQLPAGIAAFTGRAEVLRQLDALLDGGPSTVVITAIGGAAGIEKTTLVVHWAHRVRDRFPDGQLYVNLRGFDPGGRAVAPTEAVRGFLDALGVSPQQVPAEFDAQVGRYRSLVADRRMLVVLDNARDAEQVRPLLPGAPGCLVVVTSRNPLTGLVATEGARPLSLDLLTEVEAREMLAGRMGADRIDAEPDAVDEIVDRCAGLPLALAVVAARAAGRPQVPLQAFADQLGDRSLDVLDGGDARSDVRSVLSWSYQGLSAGAAQTLARLGTTYRAVGEQGAAQAAWEQALSIFEEIGRPEADEVRAKLKDL